MIVNWLLVVLIVVVGVAARIVYVLSVHPEYREALRAPGAILRMLWRGIRGRR